MVGVPLDRNGPWLAYTPTFTFYPDVVVDLEEYPITARLFHNLTTTTPSKSHADPMTATWTHMLALNCLLAGALEQGYQSFDAAADGSQMHLVAGTGEKYVVEEKVAYVERTDGTRVEHVQMETLLKKPVLAKIHVQESALFAAHVWNSCHDYREILWVDANHVETRDLKQSATFSGINYHLAKVITCMDAASPQFV